MSSRSIPDGDVAEDGHPCEAALQFRRSIVRMGVAEDVSADALDLAITFAWIGKAVSRTSVSAEWQIAGIDPNTYLIVPLLACSGDARRKSLEIAVRAQASAGMVRELGQLRASSAFQSAVATMRALMRSNPSARDVLRLSELAGLSSEFPKAQRTMPRTGGTGNVVMLDRFRTRRQAAS
ncbi:hypothetical protein G6L37_03505 [Agrobacterium rubi]|nr:hypothetical protein [Agrobacterium rubi]NTF24438.1 hypothetical protein [Agrobacterium rubi]